MTGDGLTFPGDSTASRGEIYGAERTQSHAKVDPLGAERTQYRSAKVSGFTAERTQIPCANEPNGPGNLSREQSPRGMGHNGFEASLQN